MPDAFRSRYGPRALVAGGSVGLGAEWARQLAARGLDLVVVAESDDPLKAHCEALAREYGVDVRSAVIDLADADVLDRVQAELGELEIGLLVYNAAQSYVGNFLDQDLDGKLRTLDVNCRGPLLLAHHFGRAMAERGRGGIVLMSSLSCLQGTPLVATYAATKAFNLILGEALWEELRHLGVDVLTVIAGAMRTPGWEQTRPDQSRFSPPVMEVEPVVREALGALGRTPSIVPGRANRWSARLLSRLLPRKRAVETMGRSMRSLYADQVKRQPIPSGTRSARD